MKLPRVERVALVVTLTVCMAVLIAAVWTSVTL